MRRLISLYLIVGLAASTAAAGSQPSFGSEADLQRSLRNYIVKRWGVPEGETRYAAVLTDLNGDGRKEALVYVSGRYWCGSGGCDLWILTPRSQSWTMVTQTTVTWPPIRVLTTRTRGWRDIAVGVAGGGITPGHEAVLRFNGRSYPTNPSTIPAPSRVPSGEVVIPRQTEGRLLFP
jgi:hypothetical protein